MQELNQRNATVNSTEEYTLLVKEIRAQGGHVLHTFPLKGEEQGISVQYEVPTKSKE